jgi:hypothetical protein
MKLASYHATIHLFPLTIAYFAKLPLESARIREANSTGALRAVQQIIQPTNAVPAVPIRLKHDFVLPIPARKAVILGEKIDQGAAPLLACSE